MIPHNRTFVSDREIQAVRGVLESGWPVRGPVTEQTEKYLRDRSGAVDCVLVSSGTAALRLALIALGRGNRDEVIVPSYCCVAIPNAVLSVGAVPKVVDVDEQFMNYDMTRLKAAVGDKTKAIILVHNNGIIRDAARLADFDVPVVEDRAHTFFFDRAQNRVPAENSVVATSFYPTKYLGGIGGGAVLTASKDIGAKVRDLRAYADKEASPHRINEDITDVEAAVVLSRLQGFEDFVRQRRNVFTRLHEGLKDRAEIGKSIEFHAEGVSYYRFLLRFVEPAFSFGDNAGLFRRLINERGIVAEKPIELWTKPGDFAGADRLYRNIVSLPCYPSLDARAIETIVRGAKDTLADMARMA